MHFRLVFVALAAATFALAPSSDSWAQDDWSVRRDPFDKGTIRRYKKILRRRPHDSSALSRLSQLYRRYRSLDKLVGEYQKELDRDSKNHATLVVLGRLELSRGRHEAAAGFLERALAVKAADFETSIALGELYRRLSKPAKARSVFDRALATKPGTRATKRLLHKLATLAEASGDIDGSEAYFNRYLKLSPGDVQARLELGDALLKHKKFGRAIAVLQKAEKKLKRDPMRRIEVIARLGGAFEGAGDEDGAIREYRRAMAMARRGNYIRKELTARVIDIYRRRQTLSELISFYEEKWPARRRDHFEWDTMARLYEEVGREDKAVSAFRRATKKSPFELDTHRRLIRLYETIGREDDALKHYETVIRIAPGEPRFQLELAERYYRRGKRKKALALLRRLQSRFGGDAGVYTALADMYARWGEEDLALKAHARLTRIEPGEVMHLVNLGEQHFQKGNRKKAINIWRRIISKRTADNYARLGRVYAEHDMPTPALEMYGKAIKQRAKDAKLYKGRAAVHERKKDWRSAVRDWEKVYALTENKPSNKPARQEARRRIVSLLKRSGRRSLESRISTWRRAFAAKDIEAGYFLVAAYLKLGRAPNARKTLEQLRSIAPKDNEPLLQLVKVYRLEQRYEDAVSILLELVKRIPARERDFFNQIAELKTRLNRDKEAIFYAQKALEKSPNDPTAYEQLAERYLEMQQYSKAIAALEKTVELAPRNFRAYFGLARLYRNTHRLDRAADLYRRILKRATDDDILFKAGRHAINLEELTGSLGDLERVVSPLAFTFGHKDVYRQILVKLYSRHVPQLIAKTRTGNRKEKRAALTELGRLGSHGLKPLLEALADERDPEQRRIAVSVLGYLGNASAAAPLVRLAKQGSKRAVEPRLRALGTLELSWDLRIEALVAAGRLADPRTIEDLLALTKHREVAMREAATFALGMTRDKRAIRPLIGALDDQRESVQALACLGLGHIGGRQMTKHVLRVFADRDRHDSVRAACAYALGFVGDARAHSTLATVLTEGNDETQRLAAWALGRLGAKKAIPSLLTAYFGRRASLRDAIAWAIPRAASGTRTTDQVPFLDYPMRSGKFDLTRAISSLPGPLSAPKLSPGFVVDHQSDVVAALKSTLVRHRDLVHRVLAELDEDPDHVTLGALVQAHREQAPRLRRSLREIGVAIAPELVSLASHADPVVRRHALSVLAKTGWAPATEVLAKALQAPSLEHRIAAMNAISPLMRRGGRASRRLLPAVVRGLTARDWREQVAAATALGHYGKSSDETALTSLVGDRRRKAFVRQAAVTALGRLGRPSAVPVLETATTDPARAVQEQAVLALRSIGGPKARRALIRISKNPRSFPSTRSLAAASGRRGNGKK